MDRLVFTVAQVHLLYARAITHARMHARVQIRAARDRRTREGERERCCHALPVSYHR